MKNKMPEHNGYPGEYWEGLLTALAMGDLNPRQKALIDVHLQTCSICREELGRIKNFFKNLPDPVEGLDDVKRNEILAAIKAKLPQAQPAAPSPAGWFWAIFGGNGLKAAYAVAAVILIGLVINLHGKLANPQAYQLHVISGDTLVAGAPASVRVLVDNANAESPGPVRGVPVTIGIKDTEGHSQALFKGRTDSFGTIDASFKVPENTVGDYTLYVDVPNTNTGEPLSFPITSGKPASILLNTDKPLYKPEQVVHIKGLLRDPVSGKGISGRDVTIEIENPDGTKIFRKPLKTSDWGIVSTELHLSDLAQTGKYLIRATADKDNAELDFTVDKYVLPKFKITIDTDSGYYLPGDLLKGTITADYHFGKPVANGDVTIKFSTFDVGPNLLETITKKLDGEGKYAFEYKLPDFFAGSSFLEGGTELYIDVDVRDTGGQKFASTKSVQIYPDRLMLRAVPAGGRVVGDTLNTIYILAYRPDHSPVSITNVKIGLGNKSYDAAEVTPGMLRTEVEPIAANIRKGEQQTIALTITGNDPDEGAFNRRLTVNAEPEGLLLMTNAVYYKPGDAIECIISAPDYVKTVFIDLYGSGHTILTKSVQVKDGKAELTLSPPADTNGKVEVRAYAISHSPIDARWTGGAEIWLRDARIVFMESEKAGGEIATKFDTNEYLPGGKGNLNIELKDANGNPVQGALGLKMVDEALYTLAGEKGNLESLYRELVKDILEPEFQIKGEEFLRHFKGLVEPVAANNPEGGRAIGNVIAAQLRPMEVKFAVDMNNAEVVPMMASYSKEQAWGSGLKTLMFLISLAFLVYLAANILLWTRPVFIALPGEGRDFIGITKTAFWPFIWLGLLPPVYIISSFAMLYKLWVSGLRYTTNRAFAAKFGSLSLLYLLLGILGFILLIVGYKGVELSVFARIPWWYLLAIGLIIAITVFINRLVTGVTISWRPFAIGSVAICIISLFGLAILIGPFLFGAFGAKSNATRGALAVKAVPPMAGEKWDKEAEDFAQLRGEAGALGRMEGAPMAAPDMMKKAEAAPGPMPLQALAPGAPGQQPRLRQRFPETMLWVPELVTDPDGKATLPIDFADSITDWRLDADAITSQGGYLTHQMDVRVFQPLFVDMDLPVELRRGDYIELPVVVYNFLNTEQRVRVELKPDAGFELSGQEYEQFITLKPGEVGAVHYPITAKKVGKLNLEVAAYGPDAADRVSRELGVIPEGIKKEESLQGKLNKGENTFAFTIPEAAVPDSDIAVLKLHPGVMSQIVEGLDNIFNKPYGCFEQTSSITYPNILALKYMRDTKQVRPETEAKALTFIEMGYQRLLSFEVKGGGFDWFGNAPSNIMLSAYGLMEFKDMSDVSYVDNSVLERTYNWLASKQEADGAFFSQGGIPEGITSYGSTRGKATAFVAWALRHAGYGDTDTYRRAIGAIEKNLGELTDDYVRALILNAIGDNANYKDTANKVADALAASAVKDADGLVHWKTKSDTAVYSFGDSADVETTAIAVLGLIETGLHTDLVEGAVNWLVSKKIPDGTWPTTSGTVMSLKALINAEGKAGRNITGNVEVILNGQKLETISLTKENNDLLQMVDLRPALRIGRNDITVTADTTGLAYQLSYWYNTPGTGMEGISGQINFEVKVDYDRTELASGDKVKVNVSVANRDMRDAMMVLVDLGLAPGFAPDAASLDDLVDKGKIMRWERKGSQITIYLEKVASNSNYDFNFDITSSFPIRANSGEVKAYRYYEPAGASVKPGVDFKVA